MTQILRNTVYLLVLGVLSPWLVVRGLRTGRYRQGWRQKLWGCDPLLPKPPGSVRIWLHGVSVGEVQLLGRLMDQLRHSMHSIDFVVSTTTDTGMDLARKLYGTHSDTQLIHYPLDFSWAVRRTIHNVAADQLVLGELEVWPNLLDIAAASQLPVAVVNGRLSAKSYRGYRRLSWLTRPMFSQLKMVAAQTPEYASRFVDCGVPEECVEVSGSFKFDNVNFDSNSAEVTALADLVGLNRDHLVWVLGSSQDPEEITACEAFLRSRSQHPQLKLIVVPRHRERFDEVFHKLRRYPVKVLRRSTLSAPVAAHEWDVLVVDTIGELRWWWGLSQLALVGGSFGARNGQNMLEPAAYGASVAFGPCTLNFRAIVELLLSANAAEQITDLAGIQSWLDQQLTDPLAAAERGRRAQQLVEQHQGAVQRTAAQLLRLLPKQSISIRDAA